MTPFEEILNRSLEIHKKKREDYTTNPDSNPYENFTRANEIVSWFPPEYKSFASHIGTKLARLGSLLQDGRKPNNESLDDSFLDLVTYCGLMYGFYKQELDKRLLLSMNLLGNSVVKIQSAHLPSDKILYKSSDSPDPTEPCLHPSLNENRYCRVCFAPVNKTDVNIFYYKSGDTYVRRT